MMFHSCPVAKGFLLAGSEMAAGKKHLERQQNYLKEQTVRAIKWMLTKFRNWKVTYAALHSPGNDF